eukprot:1152118-Pelagomonas_calceolata.AAC.8
MPHVKLQLVRRKVGMCFLGTRWVPLHRYEAGIIVHMPACEAAAREGKIKRECVFQGSSGHSCVVGENLTVPGSTI